jgi:putative AbiEi antitoxin of type IV toxin-antitoxin system
LGLSGLVPPMRGKLRTADWVIHELATRSHGIVTRGELLGAGLSPKQIENRLGKGVLALVHRGVYRAGHLAPSVEATYLAAVKACGPGALLAGRAAAHLWGLTKATPSQIEVLAPTDRHIPGLIVHRARRTELGDATERFGIPVTNVPRTLLDIASSLPEPALARACHEAGVKYRTTPRQVEAVLERLSNASGRAKLLRIIGAKVPVTLSRLESRSLSRLRKAGLPLPITNRMAGNRRVDCRWPEDRLTVELDSYRFHNSRHSWERDRLREREARMRGDEFRRYSWADVFEAPAFMLTELRRLLG